ncbi:hypothetical protein KIW84_045634 [Lathyrus oleraceus]|uniref:Uncharacterized protein n=1 Tax=Pisum sativum TaxID=3888 RepID=A0A9D4XLL4_PEA|nr:hypothetical protein KIW84_045634 [Pisum sativum]
MTSHFPQKIFSDKQQSKRPMPSSNISPSQIPKRSRTKVKASKVILDARVVKKKFAKSQSAETLISFVLSISSLFVKTMPWIIAKFLYSKPKNWGKVDDNDLYLMCDLLTESETNWVIFIIERMIHCRDNPNRPLFFSSFVKMILEINRIVSKEEDLTEAQKIIDYGSVPKMRYYRDSYGDYYCLKEYGWKIYNDKLDELVGRIFYDNQIREERIMEQIDSVAKTSEESREKLKGELEVETPNSEAWVIAQVESMRGVVHHLSRFNVIINIVSPDFNADTDLKATAPASDDVATFP